jgi:hypothetical protein
MQQVNTTSTGRIMLASGSTERQLTCKRLCISVFPRAFVLVDSLVTLRVTYVSIWCIACVVHSVLGKIRATTYLLSQRMAGKVAARLWYRTINQ